MQSQGTDDRGPHPEDGNIDFFCAEHGPKPIFTVEPVPPATTFVGAQVKRAFTSKEGRIEHMWVRVERIEHGRLVGALANVPLYDHGLTLGSRVVVEIAEIEAVHERTARRGRRPRAG